MDIEKFKYWLESDNRKKETIQNRISNCKKVEMYEGNLDVHFNNDHGLSLLNKLNFSKKDEKDKNLPKHNIPINGNIRTGSATLKQALKLYMSYKKEYSTKQDIIEIEELKISNRDINELEKKILVKYRVGQSVFRKQLIDYWGGKCSVSKLERTELLIASHIKPYFECNNLEKYDLYNGLLLSPNYDKLFDNHLISFDSKGKILISNKLSEQDLKKMNISRDEKIIIEEKHNYYLEFHRKKI